MKKLFAVLMAMIMAFSICVPSFAVEIDNNSNSVGSSSIVKRTVESSYKITIPTYIQATETNEFPTISSGDEEKTAIAEEMSVELKDEVIRIVSEHKVTYYSAILLMMTEESDEMIALAKQGDDVIKKAVETAMSSEFGSDADGNPITNIDDYFSTSMGISLRELATYLEYGVISFPEQLKNAVYYDVKATNVLIDDMKELRVTVNYDNVLSDTRGAKLDYKLYNKCTYVNNGDVILTVDSGNPEAVYSTAVSAMVEPALFAGTFTDTVTFNASVDYSGTVYEIGATQPDYVLAVFNKDFTKVVIRPNGDNSDGLMMNFTSKDDNNPMYKHVDTLKEAVFESGIKNVGDNTFGYNVYGASSILSSLTLCNTIETIGEYAFGYSDMKEITIPSSVKTIGRNAFYGSLLENVNFENGVETIDDGAFSNCWLTEIDLPASVKNIDFLSAFSGSSTMYNKITKINISADNPYLSSVDGVVYNKDMTTLLYYPLYKVGTTFTIPESVTEIGISAFSKNQNLITLEIPDTVKTLNQGAFSRMKSLTSVKLGKGVVSIPQNAFAYCKGLTEITIPSNVESIGGEAFLQCSIKNVIISDGVLNIGYRAFAECFALTSVSIPSSVNYIAENAFAYDDRINAIYGVSGSCAETFAVERGYTFIAQS